jgi:hypothetical protein
MIALADFRITIRPFMRYVLAGGTAGRRASLALEAPSHAALRLLCAKIPHSIRKTGRTLRRVHSGTPSPS